MKFFSKGINGTERFAFGTSGSVRTVDLGKNPGPFRRQQAPGHANVETVAGHDRFGGHLGRQRVR